MKVTKIYALEQSKDPFWPIGFCVAYVLGGDLSEAAQLYARHRLGNGVIHVDGWVGARTSLLRALTAGKIEALGVRPDDDQRVLIPAHEWMDLRIQQRGRFCCKLCCWRTSRMIEGERSGGRQYGSG
jgi:hypothetical protein